MLIIDCHAQIYGDDKAGPELAAILPETVKLARYPNLCSKLTFIPAGSDEPYPCLYQRDGPGRRRTAIDFGKDCQATLVRGKYH